MQNNAGILSSCVSNHCTAHVHGVVNFWIWFIQDLWPYPFMKSLYGGEAGINWAPMVGLGLGVVDAGKLITSSPFSTVFPP
ncbi:hypothetical protein BC833DRAFT_620815 [Globomyces pollinis-pini]|nr:hypothetical protein BC833DRAFT_620815 [Globomyces pollinis-pini]